VALVVASLPLLVACKDESSAGATADAAPSASAAAAASSASPSASTASAAPSASASAPEPPHDCPPGSTGVGSYTKPCDAKGNSRLMEVKWKKTDDKGPWFAVTSKAKTTILWGRIAVYFYDKAGKQLDVTDDTQVPAKQVHYYSCSGATLFGGPMNPGDKYTIAFDCVPKKVIPDGAATIEAEIPMVGFADSTGKKIDYYWRNADLSPDARPKGGVK
jgi:hypothetical protein